MLLLLQLKPKVYSLPLGVDEPSPEDPSPYPGLRRIIPPSRPYTDNLPICISWSAGACKFPETCNFHHVCSACVTHTQVQAQYDVAPVATVYVKLAGCSLPPPPPLYLPT